MFHYSFTKNSSLQITLSEKKVTVNTLALTALKKINVLKYFFLPFSLKFSADPPIGCSLAAFRGPPQTSV